MGQTEVKENEETGTTEGSTENEGLTTFNPATEEPLETVPIQEEDEVNETVERAHRAQRSWKERPVDERADKIRDFRDELVDRRMEVAKLLSDEVGKPIVEALGQEIAVTAEMATYYANKAPEVLEPERVSHRLLKQKKSWVVHEPKGVVGLITPWNYPLVLLAQSVLSALVAGNAVVNKPSRITPLASLKVQELFRDSGLPENLFQVVTGTGSKTGAALVDADVQHVGFTGSVPVGRHIAKQCGEKLISSTMELGGKDAAIVLDDAPIERTVNGLTWGAFTNCGQICASLERVFVDESIYDDVVEGVVENTQELPREDVDVGPMADPDQRDVVRQQIEDARDQGSTIHTGGEQPDRKGYFYPPTVLSDLPDDADILHDESFGPILPIVPVKSEEEALERTNDSNFGLTSSIWTEDRDHARDLARDVEAGSVYINDHVTPQGGPEVPWGGIKESGVGRTRGEEGLREMTEPKHIADERLNLDKDFFWYPYSDTFTSWLNRAMPWPFKWWLGG